MLVAIELETGFVVDAGDINDEKIIRLKQDFPQIYDCFEIEYDENVKNNFRNYVVNDTRDGVIYSDQRNAQNDIVKTNRRLDKLRRIRDVKLKESDWVTLGDVNMEETLKQQWLIYRQELRDWTVTHNQDVDWRDDIPIPPGETRETYLPGTF